MNKLLSNKMWQLCGKYLVLTQSMKCEVVIEKERQGELWSSISFVYMFSTGDYRLDTYRKR